MQEFDYTHMNTSNTIMYIQVTQQRMMETTFKLEGLNFTWKVEGFKKNSMRKILQIQITWDFPLQISPSLKQDVLVLVFNGSELLLKPINVPSILNTNQYVLTKSVRK